MYAVESEQAEFNLLSLVCLMGVLLLQDVRLKDIAAVSKAHAALSTITAQQEMRQLQQSGADIHLLANCFNSSSCAPQIKPADLQMRDVEQMVARLQQQLIS